VPLIARLIAPGPESGDKGRYHGRKFEDTVADDPVVVPGTERASIFL
jgi:hypothetical protein